MAKPPTITSEFEPREEEFDTYMRCILVNGPAPSSIMFSGGLLKKPITASVIIWARDVDEWYLNYMHVNNNGVGYGCAGYRFRRRFINWCREMNHEQT